MVSDPREFDLLIVDASGFIGKYIVHEAPRSHLRTLALVERNPYKVS